MRSRVISATVEYTHMQFSTLDNSAKWIIPETGVFNGADICKNILQEIQRKFKVKEEHSENINLLSIEKITNYA